MTLSDIFAYVTKVGIDITITTKARAGDQFYVSAYRPAMNSHARKAFSTEAELLSALRQVVGELVDEPPRGPCTLGIGCNEAGVCYADRHGEGMMCGASEPQENLDDFNTTVDILAHEFG